jgi:hypothetical protein
MCNPAKESGFKNSSIDIPEGLNVQLYKLNIIGRGDPLR